MKFSGIIRAWYEKNKRSLPWRQGIDPYRIWLSEIILQQTRVDQGLDYYLRFLEHFPDVHALAAASEEEVLKCWQGLGYYSRARNLHATARHVASLGGSFPKDFQGLLELKGIGPYTAAAMASICFGEARAVVDGNVSRVIARMYGLEEAVNSTAGMALVKQAAQALMDEARSLGIHAGEHNQAMMEFGALQCRPGQPDCEACPLSSACAARLAGRVQELPVKLKKKAPVKRWMDYLVMRSGTQYLLEKREANDIWKGLYQFPLVETERDPESSIPGLKLLDELGLDPDAYRLERISPTLRHQLSHRSLHARFLHLNFRRWPRELPGHWIKVDQEKLDDFPVSRLMERYLESL